MCIGWDAILFFKRSTSCFRVSISASAAASSLIHLDLSAWSSKLAARALFKSSLNCPIKPSELEGLAGCWGCLASLLGGSVLLLAVDKALFGTP